MKEELTGSAKRVQDFLRDNGFACRVKELPDSTRTAIEAAKAIGASTPRIMIHHILPQVVPLLIVLASIAIPGAVSTEASLSFLGLGVQPPAPSWGNMLSGPGRANMTVAPWLILAPGIALSVVVLAYNMLGDSLRDVLDPRLRGSRRS